jgi:hypothetical protein
MKKWIVQKISAPLCAAWNVTDKKTVDRTTAILLGIKQ